MGDNSFMHMSKTAYRALKAVNGYFLWTKPSSEAHDELKVICRIDRVVTCQNAFLYALLKLLQVTQK